MHLLIALLPVTLLAEAALLGPADLPETPPGPAFGIERESFTLPSTVPGNPQVTCHIAWPVAADGRRSTRQGDLVLYLQHPKERFYLPPQKTWDYKTYEHLVSEGGFTVCGVFFENMAEEEVDVLRDRSRSYIFRESGSYPVLRSALDEVRRRRSLPVRPVFTFGYSAGGILAQRFAEAYPDQVDGVASLGGRHFHQGGGSQAAHLLLSALGDTGTEDHAGIMRWLDLRGVPGARLETAPDWGKRGQYMFYHCLNRLSTHLALRWIEGVADQRRAGVPAAEAKRWPYVADRRDPSRVVSTQQAGWRQVVPTGQEVWLPSAAVARLWLGTPSRPSSLVPGWTWARPARAQSPRGVVLYRWRQHGEQQEAGPDPSLGTMDVRSWDAYHLADLGLIACLSETPGGSIDAVQPALRAAGMDESLPLILVESAEAIAKPPAGLAARIVIATAAEATPDLAARIQGTADDRFPVRCLVLGDPKQAPPLWPRTKPAKGGAAKAPQPSERCRVIMLDPRGRSPQTLHGMICQRISEVVAEQERAINNKSTKEKP
jgi:pimeloyl-ACP methyl ester carboxylesterase